MTSNFRVFISKKMKTTQNNAMTTLSWNKRNNLLACGYKNGDVIINQVNESRSQPGTLQSTSVQSLAQHKQPITSIEWNEDGSLIFSGDKSGKIIFWTLVRKKWKSKLNISDVSSPVNTIKWNRRSKMLAASFENGSLFYSFPNGDLKWSTQIRQPIEHIEFINGQYLLCGTSYGEIIVLNENGIEVSTVPLPCLSQSTSEPKIVSIQYHPRADYRLLIAFKEGIVQLMRNHQDCQPIIIKISSEITAASWFRSGSVFAVCALKEDGKSSIIFFDSLGNSLRELDVSNSPINSIAFNCIDTQIALCSSDTFFLAQILPTFLNAYTKNTLLYAFNNSESFNFTLVYFNYLLKQKRVHTVDKVINISGDNGYFAVFSQDPSELSDSCKITITDTIGVYISSCDVPFIPTYFSMHGDVVAFANSITIGIWGFLNESDPKIKIFSKEKDEIKEEQSETETQKSENDKFTIHSICLFQTSLIVTIPNCIIFYDSYSFNEVKRGTLNITPVIVKSSCDMTRLALVDSVGTLQFFNVPTMRTVGSSKKDVSSVFWSSNIPSFIASSEKQKLAVYDNMILDDTFQTLSTVVDFNELEILTVDLMQIMQNPLEPDKKQFKSYPTKLLKKLKKMLADRPVVTLEKTMEFVRQQKQARLWDELGQILLVENNLPMAEKCYLENMNYKCLQFIKRIKAVRDPKLQRAQILSYFGRFDDAQTIYESIDRTDLSVEMRSLIGDHQMIINILGSSSSDESVANAYENLGDMFIENHDWKSAVQAFQKSKNKAKLAAYLFVNDDFSALNKLLKKQSASSQLLPFLGRLFLAIGAIDEAANAFMTSGDIQSAIEVCARLNNWKKALELAKINIQSDKDRPTPQRTSPLVEIRAKMNSYTSELIENGQISAAVDFYSQAGLEIEAAKLLINQGDKLLKNFQSLLNAKKCYIFAGLKLTDHLKSGKQAEQDSLNSTKKGKTSLTEIFMNDNLVEAESLLEETWRKAEAIHFYLLGHRLLNHRKWKHALLCAIRVYELYSDIIGEERSAGLLAVCGLKTGFFQQCSKAFTSLEYSDNFSSDQREKFQNLAIDVFLSRPPKDPETDQEKFCPKCQTRLSEFVSQCKNCGYKIPLCVASALLVTEKTKWVCQHCNHEVSFEAGLESMPVCPFCHQLVTS